MRYTDCPVMLSVVPVLSHTIQTYVLEVFIFLEKIIYRIIAVQAIIKLVALLLVFFYQDTLGGSSTGWTDEKHMLYISSLELSFVTKLYDGEVNSNGVLCWSSSEWRHKNHNGNHRNIEVDQVFTVLSHSSIRTNIWYLKFFLYQINSRYIAGWLRLMQPNPDYHRLSIRLHMTRIRMTGKLIIWMMMMMMHQLVIQDKRESVTMQDGRTLEGLVLPICTGMGIPFLEQVAYLEASVPYHLTFYRGTRWLV
jgi:hypothetical protein